MLAELVRLLPRVLPVDTGLDLVPVYGGVLQYAKTDDRDGDGLALGDLHGVEAPVVRCGDDHAQRERHLLPVDVAEHPAGCGQECVHVGLGDGMVLGVALALDRPILPVLRPGNQIDAGIPAPEVGARGKRGPHPDLLQGGGVGGFGHQVTGDELLEARTLVALGIRIAAVFLEDGVE